MPASHWIDEFEAAMNAFDGERVADSFAVDGYSEDASLVLSRTRFPEGNDRLQFVF